MLALLIVIAGLLFGWMLAHFSKESPIEEPVFNAPELLEITHSKEGTTHFYSGFLKTTECENVGVSYTVIGSVPPALELRLRVEETKGCTFVGEAERPFSVSIGSTEESVPALNFVTLNGLLQEFVIVEKN